MGSLSIVQHPYHTNILGRYFPRSKAFLISKGSTGYPKTGLIMPSATHPPVAIGSDSNEEK